MSSKRWSLMIACGLMSAALVGCQNDPEEIAHYKVPRPPRSRMLAAIIPHGERTWFVKVQGPEAAIGEHRTAFRTFLASLRFDDKADRPLKWQAVPQGWEEVKDQPKQGEFKRYATFHLPTKDPQEGPLELTVFALGKEGAAASVLANVNRWRGQLGLQPVAEEDLGALAEEMKVGAATATVVDMVGPGGRAGGGRPPFAGGGELPRPGPVADGPKAPLTYRMPDGWRPAPRKGLSVVTFEAGERARPADVTVTPLGGAAGGLVSNVNRWREQVGLQEVSAEQINKDARELEVSGAKAHVVEVVGPEKGGRRLAILAAVAPRQGTTWFFKMTGPAETVTTQRAAFEAFLRSVRFEE
ncbi:MAG: hypothetical protein IT429_07080 [Gemmataceae bacterium]|nr:hypothetical protein [Gemmataceae bacterium]